VKVVVRLPLPLALQSVAVPATLPLPASHSCLRLPLSS
jgi:hypothetical protein